MKKMLFDNKNIVVFGISFVLLVVAYVLLAQGPVSNPLSKSVAPVILVLVYCGLIPYGILAGISKDGKEKTEKKGV
ncbi:hypothetical protein QA601_02400 [Chitinispirillales bacterium ANBcel5]|uniref:hypothetical protein n=1 Tax=Cellulosispirillum alkaliphilum TaxID=3039283 RepID=UPI002A56A660|nr:hypothetical protein [Chitinispirillales bacterium ANBcel5]